MGNSKHKRTVSIGEQTFEDLKLLTWARRQQGDTKASVSAILDDLAAKYVAENQKEIDFLKGEYAKITARQNDLFGNISNAD